MPQSPPANNAIIKVGQSCATLSTIPIPSVRSPDNESFILIRTVAVAMNPTDWQTLDEPFTNSKGVPNPPVMGCDAAGVVVEVGGQVTKKFNEGDKVLGASHGGNILYPQYGTFANYILIKGDTAIHIPSHLSFEEAATLSCGFGTVALSFYRHLELPLPSLPNEVENAEEKVNNEGNFDLVKSRGADYVFDYNDPQSPSKILSLTQGHPLTLILDMIATEPSAKFCAECLSIPTDENQVEDNIIYVSLLPITLPLKEPSPKIKQIFFLGYTIFNCPFEVEGEFWDAVPEDFALCVKFCNVFEKLLERGIIKPHPVLLKSGGLEEILNEGFDLVRKGVSGVKVVYRIGKK
ncbi:hypothetical protein B7463_g12458, partial [Scytalidium lignicola]